MKKFTLLLVMVFTTITCYGQYQSIAHGGHASWDLKHEIWDGAIMDYLSLQDTITINNTLYYQVNFYNNLIGYFREDTLTGRAWFWSIYDSTEYLVMDLSLNLNETFLVKMYYPVQATVTSIDTINDRKEITLDYQYGGGFIWENLKFIEGVGPNASLLYQMDDKYSPFNDYGSGFEGGFLVCKMYNDSSLIYAWDTINYQCGDFYLALDNINESMIQLSPNPVQNLLTINLSSPSADATIAVYDVQGRKMNCNPIFTGTELQLNTEKLLPGIYLLQIINNKTGEREAGKFVKE